MRQQLEQNEAFRRYQRATNALGISDYSNQIIHYTSEEVLQSILKTDALWFGALSQMNDTAECDHFLDEILANSSRLLGNVQSPDLEAVVAHIRPAIRQETYVSSWCEYFDAEPNGKLSMWRAYASEGAGLGLVIDSTQMQPSRLTSQNINFHIYSTTVDYVRANRAITKANDALRRISSLPELSDTLVEKMQMAVLLLAKSPCIKHDGFAEEEEVRFLYMKGLLNLFGQGDQNETVGIVSANLPAPYN
jgi:hypothetical protein